jgi:hypothetical protein
MERPTHVTDGAPGDPISVFALEMDGARSVVLHGAIWTSAGVMGAQIDRSAMPGAVLIR